VLATLAVTRGFEEPLGTQTTEWDEKSGKSSCANNKWRFVRRKSVGSNGEKVTVATTKLGTFTGRSSVFAP
jgi:hypothetical protein